MQSRIDKLCEKMHDNEAVFISSYPNIFYYSGFTSEDAYLLISHSGKYIITDSRYTIQAREQAKGFEVIDIAKGFEKIFSRIDEKYIGFEESYMSVGENKRIRAKLKDGQDFVEMQNLINKPREIKDECEIKKIAEAEKIGDMAFEYILGRIKEGVTEREIALDLEFFMKKQGATALSFDTISASGIRSAMPHGIATDKKIENGDFLTLDFGCVFEGYCSDMTRTVVVGKADAKQREVYDLCRRMTEDTEASVRAGVTGTSCYEASLEAIKDTEYLPYNYTGIGHGVGLFVHELPNIGLNCENILQENSIMTVEPGLYIPGWGGVRLEDQGIITKDGYENLISATHELIEL